MIPQENRLTKKRDFNLIISHGRWVSAPGLSLKALNLAENRNLFPKKEDPDKFEKQLKIAFSVGLKYSKKAVERNRMRRQISEVVRLHLKNSDLKPGFYLLFTAQPAMKNYNFAEISQKVKLLLRQGKLLQDKLPSNDQPTPTPPKRGIQPGEHKKLQ
ncbi:MAG: ribonuclease P protein component [Patescibacteria group bacterium]